MPSLIFYASFKILCDVIKDKLRLENEEVLMYSYCNLLPQTNFGRTVLQPYFCAGEMAERSNAAVLKTVEGYTSWGSNP